jgi:hypothetical protein
MESEGEEKVPIKSPTLRISRTAEGGRSHMVYLFLDVAELSYSVRLNRGTAMEKVTIANTER